MDDSAFTSVPDVRYAFDYKFDSIYLNKDKKHTTTVPVMVEVDVRLCHESPYNSNLKHLEKGKAI